MDEPQDLTRLLQDAEGGDADAAEELWRCVYDEMRRMARAHIASERKGHSLQATDLVHEVYPALARASLKNRAHFFATASMAMRHARVNHAKARSRQKRGGGVRRVPLDVADPPAADRPEELLSLDAALTKLASVDAEQARVVELKYFGGFTVDEISDALGVAPRSVARLWQVARDWMREEMTADLQK